MEIFTKDVKSNSRQAYKILIVLLNTKCQLPWNRHGLIFLPNCLFESVVDFMYGLSGAALAPKK
jgi:hypothetical protein